MANSSDKDSNSLNIYYTPNNDGYKWKIYTKRWIKDYKIPKVYYKCINFDCSVKKTVCRNSHEEINVEYNGENHNHQPPNPTPPTITELLDTRTGEVIYNDIEGNKWTCYWSNLNPNGIGFSRAYFKCIYPNCPVKKSVVEDKIILYGEHNHQPPNSNIQKIILRESIQLKLQNLEETNTHVNVGSHHKRMRSKEVTTSELCSCLKVIEENLAEPSHEVSDEVELSRYIADFQKLL